MAEIQWPWQYNFPPFFTLQPNSLTREKQMEAWRKLILEYFRLNKQYILDLSDISNSTLFNNASISRSLYRDDVLVILKNLAESGNAEPLDKQKHRWYIYWHPLREWADIIYNWVQKSNRTNTVVTFYEITSTETEDFYGLNENVLVKALKLLETEGKAEIIALDENSGVKFFN